MTDNGLPPVTQSTITVSNSSVEVGTEATLAKSISLSQANVRKFFLLLDQQNTQLNQATNLYGNLNPSGVSGSAGFSDAQKTNIADAITLLNSYGYSYETYSNKTGNDARNFLTRLQNDLDVVKNELLTLSQQSQVDLQTANDKAQELTNLLATINELFYTIGHSIIGNYSR